MMIEIKNVGFANKGAELMLREIVRRVRKDIPHADLALDVRRGAYEERIQLCLYQLLRYQRFKIRWDKFCPLLPKSFRNAFGIVLEDEVEAVLDASGFKYGDIWGLEHLKRLAGMSKKWHEMGKKHILLPQAFGPFSGEAKEYIRSVVQYADLVYPRDEISYKNIVHITGERENVRISPDFTAPLPGFLRPEHEHLEGRFCSIPNAKMVQVTAPEVSGSYVPLMGKCIELAERAGLRPFILIHATGDIKLAREIADGMSGDVEIIREQDACAVKGIIGASAVVVSSRFHGLVSALCQGVPALGTGWSHKYEMLFGDYGIDDGLIPVPCDEGKLREKLAPLFEEGTRKRMSERLSQAAAHQREAIESMWNEVFAVLKR